MTEEEREKNNNENEETDDETNTGTNKQTMIKSQRKEKTKKDVIVINDLTPPCVLLPSVTYIEMKKFLRDWLAWHVVQIHSIQTCTDHRIGLSPLNAILRKTKGLFNILANYESWNIKISF